MAASAAYFQIPDLVDDDLSGVLLALGPSDTGEHPAKNHGPATFMQSWTRGGETLHVLYRIPSERILAFEVTAVRSYSRAEMSRIVTAQRLSGSDRSYRLTLVGGLHATGFLVVPLDK